MTNINFLYAVAVVIVIVATAAASREAERARVYERAIDGFWQSTNEYRERAGADAFVYFQDDAVHIVIDDGKDDPLLNRTSNFERSWMIESLASDTHSYRINFAESMHPLPDTLVMRLDAARATAELVDDSGTVWMSLQRG